MNLNPQIQFRLQQRLYDKIKARAEADGMTIQETVRAILAARFRDEEVNGGP